jgi:hypothetical protein
MLLPISIDKYPRRYSETILYNIESAAVKANGVVG